MTLRIGPHSSSRNLCILSHIIKSVSIFKRLDGEVVSTISIAFKRVMDKANKLEAKDVLPNINRTQTAE